MTDHDDTEQLSDTFRGELLGCIEIKRRVEAERNQARATIRRLNRRAQVAESALNRDADDRAEEWPV